MEGMKRCTWLSAREKPRDTAAESVVVAAGGASRRARFVKEGGSESPGA